MGLEDIEREHILEAFLQKKCLVSGKDGAAQALDVKHTTLQSRMRKMGIQRPNWSAEQDRKLISDIPKRIPKRVKPCRQTEDGVERK